MTEVKTEIISIGKTGVKNLREKKLKQVQTKKVVNKVVRSSSVTNVIKSLENNCKRGYKDPLPIPNSFYKIVDKTYAHKISKNKKIVIKDDTRSKGIVDAINKL